MSSWVTALRTRYKSYRHSHQPGRIEQKYGQEDEKNGVRYNDLYTSGLHHFGTTHTPLSDGRTASAENTEAALNGRNMLLPRRRVPSSALSECGGSCQPATNSTGEANSTVHNCERGVVMTEQPGEFSTLEVSGLEYSEALHSNCGDAVTQPEADSHSNILEDLESSPTSGSVIPRKKEWIPTMLGKWPAFSLALVLFFLVGLLEYFDRLNNERNGFPADRQDLLLTTRFLPTIIVVLLASIWRMMIRDLKKVTPWAAMSNKWEKPEACILANYIDDLDITSLWTSFRRRHWGVLLGLIGGFLCGALVPFAGGLFYVDPAHGTTYNTTLVRTSKFDFGDSFSAFNWSDPYINQPIAAIAANSLFGSQLPTWTTNEYAFESFNLSNAPSNVSISGNSMAFSADLDCDTLHYNSEVVGDWHTDSNPDLHFDPNSLIRGLGVDVRLIPNREDMARIGCDIPPSYYSKVIFPRPSNTSLSVQPAAWVNVTTCSTTSDERLTFTIMELLNQDSQSIDQSNISFSTTGLLCKPHFNMSIVELAVNASTAELVDIKLLSNTSEPIALGINTTMLSAAINRPAVANLFYDGTETLDGFLELSVIPDNQWDYMMEFGTLLPYLGRIGTDPWFSMLTAGNLSRLREYSANMSSLGVDSSQLFRNLLAQIVNSGFRVADSTPIIGLVDRQEPKIISHDSSLRCLQIAFGLLGVVALCCATILRPRSCLAEDPGTLAAVAVLVAASADFENYIDSLSLSNKRDIHEELRDTQVRLVSTGSAKPVIQVAQRTCIELWKDHNTQDQVYRPLTLYALFRFCLLAVAFAFLSALGVLLRLSDSKQGFSARNTVTSLAWSYSPSAVLVLLGYAIQGADCSAQSLRSYIALQRGSMSGKDSVLFRSANLSPLDRFHVSFWKAGTWALYASTLVSMVYPAIKITAAGLYIRHLTQHSFSADIVIDQSLISYLDQISPKPGNREGFNEIATTYATWSLMPQMQFHPPFDSGSSLVFSNITDGSLSSDVELALRHEGEVSLNLPAVEIDVNCSAYGREDFRVVRQGSIVQVLCKSHSCRKYFPGFNESYAHTYGVTPSGIVWQGGFNLSSPYVQNNGIFETFSPFIEGWTDPEDYKLAPISGMLMEVNDYELERTGANESITINPNAIAGYSCTRALNKVAVNATYTRAIQRNLQGLTLLPATITSFDRRSISTVNNLPSYRTANVTASDPYYCVSMPNNTCGTSTAWITHDVQVAVVNSPSEILTSWGMSTYWSTLLAATQLQHQDYNATFLERLFDPDYLPDAAKSAYISYTALFINQLRKSAHQQGDDTVTRTATISEQADRVFQSRNITIALIVLLSVTIGCVIVILWGVPSKPVIARAPNSIFAQASLLAGSNLVRRLREQGVESVNDTKIWEEEVFSLGWWSAEGPHDGEGERKERWGIDIGVARLRNTLDKALMAPS